ncbi:hypothetical protein BUALT_Bualt16G0028800 [Buddleja alternifolia]|uniref:Uncharacterized protein n=1 Tax=Buddleja alternifolia TaxID=168488 RepID=A0AAV6W8R6_9LAMI|nr:hypothetical protein BUALT_Bualt16G0028800 [Buddleja alternifolia]
MGTKMSTPNHRHPPPPPSAEQPPQTTSTPNLNPHSPPNPTDADLSSYEAACRSDPDLRTFDSTLHLRTTTAINSIAVGSLSLDSLREVTESLLESNQEVVKIILKNKNDILKTQELSDLVDDYFENSLLTLDFCSSLGACLKRAGRIESIINVALRSFDEEHYSRTLEELRNFEGAGDPFTQEFFDVFRSVYSNQISILERLQQKKRKLDKKLGKLKVWRKISNAIFVAVFASVLICSVVAAAVAAPPVVTAALAAAAVPLGSRGRWITLLWKKCERDLRGQREIISSMQVGSYVVIKDLDSIRVLVDKLRIEIEALLANAGFAVRGEEEEEEEEEVAVAVAVEEIRRRVDDFVKIIRDLSERADKCTEETRMARTMILRRIINHPSGSNQDIGMFS